MMMPMVLLVLLAVGCKEDPPTSNDESTNSTQSQAPASPTGATGLAPPTGATTPDSARRDGHYNGDTSPTSSVDTIDDDASADGDSPPSPEFLDAVEAVILHAERATYLFTLGMSDAMAGVSGLFDAPPPSPPTRKKAGAPAYHLQALSYADLPEWNKADLTAFNAALGQHCQNLSRLPSTLTASLFDWKKEDWKKPCTKLRAAALQAADVERWLTPWQIIPRQAIDSNRTPPARPKGGGRHPAATGLLTGYAEYHVKGSPVKTARYRYPLYARPQDLVTVKRRRYQVTKEGRIRPYPTRASIQAGALAQQNLELVWLAHPLDAYISHIQGTAIVSYPNGKSVRIGYGGDNGHRYRSLMRHMLREGQLTRGTLNWQGVRASFEAMPSHRVRATLAANPRYIFFEFRPYTAGLGPTGSLPVPLTRNGSLAVDYTLIPLGSVIWLHNRSQARLVVAQDTGAAIKGALRGDLFLGSGYQDFADAERTHAQTAFYVLLPRGARPKSLLQ